MDRNFGIFNVIGLLNFPCHERDILTRNTGEFSIVLVFHNVSDNYIWVRYYGCAQTVVTQHRNC
jgi:hypothetical protein